MKGDSMFFAFRNNSADCRINLNINETSYLLESGKNVEVSFYDDFVSFSAESDVFYFVFSFVEK
jgi:hypothetical protein